MADPVNFDEYNKRCQLNQQITGFGADTTMHAPCPFCGAAEFMCWKIIETERAAANGATCKECGRSAKTVFSRTANGTSFEFVQTGGPEGADWLPFKMRRI